MATAISRRSYTEPEIERGLEAVAYCNGNTRQARRLLSEEGHDYPRETLRSWTEQTHRDRYVEIQQQLMPKIRREIAAETLNVARKAYRIQDKVLDRLDKEADELSVGQLHQVANGLAITMGINIDKSQVLSSLPNEIREHRSFADLQKALKARGVEVVIEGSGEEIDKPETST